MKQIDISTKKYPNTFTSVDDMDYESFNKHKWHPDEDGRTLYVKRLDKSSIPHRTIRMHREVLGLCDGEKGDHRDGNGLNNQRYNLRKCTSVQNSYNRKLNKNSTSGYKGVSWRKRDSRWNVTIKIGQKKLHLGSFNCLVKAAKEYDKAARKLFGEFARLNFPA